MSMSDIMTGEAWMMVGFIIGVIAWMAVCILRMQYALSHPKPLFDNKRGD